MHSESIRLTRPYSWEPAPARCARRFEGDPRAWATHTIEALLPKGSAPGLWGVVSIAATDKTGNTAFQDFVEILRFDVRTSGR